MRRVLLAILVGIGLLASSLLPTPPLFSQETGTTISVPANQPWTDTGLDLNQGDQVTITASGIIKIAGSDPGKTPAGDQGCLQSETGVAPGLTCNSLIGRIGEGEPFEVGTSLSFSVETAGRLYLGVNDDVRFFGDNSGSWTAEVEITESQADLQSTEIIFDASTAVVGDTIFFDSGVRNTGAVDSDIFNVKWFVDGQDVGAYGSHEGVPANSTVLDGNSQFSWVATEGTHTIEFVVDVDDHIEESDESNNSQAVMVTITEAGQSSFTYPMDPAERTFLIDYNVNNRNLTRTSSCYGVPLSEAWHAGEDWFAPADTPVNAVANGIVRYSSKDPGTTKSYPGGVVIIEHTLPDNSLIYSMYAHLDPSKILVSKEDDVTNGQQIADGLCNNGECRGNVHLHWEMRHFFDGSGINKAPKYKTTCSREPGPGYTYPGQPDNFVANGGTGPTYSWTDPSDFVDTH